MPDKKTSKQKEDSLPEKGKILISQPFLEDNIFSRSVVYIVNYSDEGSIGLILNKIFPLDVNDIVKSLQQSNSIPLYCGGPVGNDVLLYLHDLDYVKNSVDAGNGLYLNGDFEQIKEYILKGGIVEGHLRFFIGYSGWKKKQLTDEINEKSWIVSPCTNKIAMNTNAQQLWSDLLSNLGGKYKVWAHFPIFPSQN